MVLHSFADKKTCMESKDPGPQTQMRIKPDFPSTAVLPIVGTLKTQGLVASFAGEGVIRKEADRHYTMHLGAGKCLSDFSLVTDLCCRVVGEAGR